MKWLLIFGILLTAIGAKAQHLETVHPRTKAVVEFHPGDNVFFKKEASRAVQMGTIVGFREDSIILNDDSFLIQDLSHIGPQRPLEQLVFSAVSLYELFGAMVQYGIGGAFYVAYSTDAFVVGRPLGEAVALTTVFYLIGTMIKAQGRFFKNMVFASNKKRPIELVY